MQELDHVSHWVFDLDNTLYPPSARLFDLIEVRMTDWVMQELGVARDEADRLRAQYWRSYGTTLSGLMREHGVDPTPYLTHVHDIPLSALEPDAALAAAIRALPGRKIVYTNGSRQHAERVTEARGLGGLFDAMYGIEDAGFLPKPERGAFDAVFRAAGVEPTRAAMFEDDARNLAVPHDMGMACIHVHPDRHEAPHVHHHAPDLGAFLSQLTGRDDTAPRP
ncbi:pyrimidine 5'-nucleotidase [Frigidibacter sp. ROC022]|uniref:pyrimidine 5'-nucleotidase n=1 Tax=Frigidibacter sp. ROC022 TaxID=2971796 RepID=UPI00215B40B2|nr:pyrimidine 5'-nucleotidase [Frigidibacter sp. ROC022]MCR8725263.1 pyrimidine 5'-nucleotidase [Frigidibacter sp. ROC022]